MQSKAGYWVVDSFEGLSEKTKKKVRGNIFQRMSKPNEEKNSFIAVLSKEKLIAFVSFRRKGEICELMNVWQDPKEVMGFARGKKTTPARFLLQKLSDAGTRFFTTWDTTKRSRKLIKKMKEKGLI